MSADRSRRPLPGPRNRWIALACCGPMLLVLSALILTGVIGLGSALLGIACAAVMAAVMVAMERIENH